MWDFCAPHALRGTLRASCHIQDKTFITSYVALRTKTELFMRIRAGKRAMRRRIQSGASLSWKGNTKGREQIDKSYFNIVKWYQKEITTTDYTTDINFYPSNVVYLHSTFPESCTECWHSHSAESPHHRWSHTENKNWRSHVGQNRTGSHEEYLLDYTSSL